VIALVVVAAVAAFAPGCAKPGWSASGPGSKQFLTFATERDVASKSRIPRI
jgi:hypothetical protein